MEITKTVTIEIDIDQIIEDNDLNKQVGLEDIDDAVQDYIDKLHNIEYYLIDEEDKENICHAVLKALEEQEEDEYTDRDVQKIYEAYRSNSDCNFGVWDNIARAYDRTGLKLRRRL